MNPSGRQLIYLPTSLDVDAVGKSNRGETKAKTLHFISRLANSSYKDASGEVMFKRISYTEGKMIYGKWWEKHLNKLISAGVVEVDTSYQVGIRPKGYRLAERYRYSPLKAYEIICPILLAAERRHKLAYKRSYYTPLHWSLERDLEAFQLDPQRIPAILAEVTINHQDEVDKGKSKTSLERRLSLVAAKCHKLVSGDLGLIKRARSNKRLNHILTSTKREVKFYGKLYGQEVANVDLKNSQPLLLASLYPEIPNLMEDATSGVFYEEIMELSGIASRSQAKEDVLGCLYRCEKNGYYKPWEHETYERHDATRAITKRYRGLLETIDAERIASGHGNYLPIKLQKLEATIFIDGILSKAQARGIPAIPIHDSMLVRLSDAELIQEMIVNKVKTTTSLNAVAEIEEIKKFTNDQINLAS